MFDGTGGNDNVASLSGFPSGPPTRAGSEGNESSAEVAAQDD